MEALYQLGHSYRKSDEKAKAIETYQKVVDLFPETERARKAQGYIDDLQ